MQESIATEPRCKDFRGSPIAESFARAFVKLLFHAAYLAIADLREVGAFEKELPQLPIGVLVDAALPGEVRVGEVYLESETANKG
jgi:hypothetical protein